MHQLSSEHLNISLSIFEFELTMMPSFRVELIVVFIHPTGSLTYTSNSVWFSIKEWDDFVEKMSKGIKCKIFNLGHEVGFSLARNGLSTDIEVNLRRHISGAGEGNMKFNLRESGELYEFFYKFADSVKNQYVHAMKG